MFLATKPSGVIASVALRRDNADARIAVRQSSERSPLNRASIVRIIMQKGGSVVPSTSASQPHGFTKGSLHITTSSLKARWSDSS